MSEHGAVLKSMCRCKLIVKVSMETACIDLFIQSEHLLSQIVSLIAFRFCVDVKKPMEILTEVF